AAGVRDLYGRKIRHTADFRKLLSKHGEPDLVAMGNFIVERDAVLSMCRERGINTVHGEDGFLPHYSTCHADPLGFSWESSLTRMTFRGVTEYDWDTAEMARLAWHHQHPPTDLPSAIKTPFVLFPLQLIGDRVNVR